MRVTTHLASPALSVAGYHCDAGPGDAPFPEVHTGFSLSYVRRGTFGYLCRGARHELVASRVMVSSSLKDDYSMLTATEKLMGLYKDGLIPKTYQDFELALSGYVSGKVEAITVINRLKSLLDFETLYWGQFVEREKAIARIESLTGMGDSGLAAREK